VKLHKYIIIVGIYFINIFAQDIASCTVIYQQTKQYDFESIFGQFKDPGAQEWLASIPTESQSTKVLYYSNGISLFKDDPISDDEKSERLQEALHKADFFRAPQYENLEYYLDFNEDELIRKVEFMNRNFIVTSSIEKLPWKLKRDKVRIQNYQCSRAEFKQGENIISAWFAPEISISSGPSHFFGLPGLILAIEIDGETAFLAASIKINSENDNLIVIPENGKKVSEEKFNKIMMDKINEYKEIKLKKNYKKGKK